MNSSVDFPAGYFKEIYPAMKDCIGLSSELLADEMNLLLNIYCNMDNNSDNNDDGIINLYDRFIKIPPLSEERVPMGVRPDTEGCLEFILKISKCFPVPITKEDFANIHKLMESWDKSDAGDKELLRSGLVLLSSLCLKYEQSPDFGWSEFFHENMDVEYSYSIRPDLLRLYHYLSEEDTNGEIILQFKDGKKLKLDNMGNWFQGMSNYYLNMRLGVSDKEEALEELERDYSNKKKAGRKKENPVFDIVLMGACNLLKKAGFIPKGKLLTEKAAYFLIGYLKVMGLVKEDDAIKDDTIYIRSKISFLLKNGFKPVWYKFPFMKAEPWETEWINGLEEKGSLTPNDGYVLHPILARRMFKSFGKTK